MSRVFIILGILLILLRPAEQRSTVINSTYTAGVIQYRMANPPDSNFDITNSFQYCRLLQLVKKPLDLDIVIFPERGLAPIPSDTMVSPPTFIKYNRTGSDEDYQYNRRVHQYSLIYRDFYKYRSLHIPEGVEYFDRSLCKLQSVDDVDDVKNFDTNSLAEYMSCCSRKFSQYVVLTHYERENCINEPDCPIDGVYFYSTTIVYDRTGKLIARYHKHTGYDEPWIDEPRKVEPVTFTTDFGVTFGLLIGYDIFDSRLIDYYIYDANVTDIILSTREPDMPFLVSVRDQIALIKRANVNLLIAGHGWDSDGGIYTGLNEPMGKLLENKTLNNSLLYKKVPKIGWQEMTNELITLKSKDPMFDSFAIIRGNRDSVQLDIMPKDWTLDQFAEAGSFNVSQLDNKTTEVDKELCVRTFCCRFRAEFSFKRIEIIEENEVFYKYFMVAMRSVNKLISGSVVSIELCALMACQTDSPSSCGKSYNTTEHPLIYPWTFKSLSVTRRSNEMYMANNVYAPLAVSINETVMKERHFAFSRFANNLDDWEMRLKGLPLKNILAFGVLKRLYNAEELPNEYFGLPSRRWLVKMLVTWRAILAMAIVIIIAVVKLFMIIRKRMRNSSGGNMQLIVTYAKDTTTSGEEENGQEANESRGDTTNEQEDLGSPTRDDVTTPETVPLMDLVRQQQRQESHDTDLEADITGSMIGLRSDNDISEIKTDSTNRCSSGTITEYSTTSRVGRNEARGPGALGKMRQVQESTDSKSSFTSGEFSPGLVNTTFTLGQSTDLGDDREPGN